MSSSETNGVGPAADLRTLVEDLAERVETLEDENERLRERAEQAEKAAKLAKSTAFELEDAVTGDTGSFAAAQIAESEGPVLDRLDDLEETRELVSGVRGDVDELQEDLEDERKTRSNHDTQIERRINAVAEKADVEVSAADLARDDKLAQLLSVGPDAITDRVYAVHRRARALLEDPREWGDAIEDKNGKRVVYTAPGVRPLLDTKFGRSFTTSEIARIFAKVEELAEDSPRRVVHRKTDEGTHMLRVGVLHENDPLYWN